MIVCYIKKKKILFQSKLTAKSGAANYQWQIMQSLGLTDNEIKKFADSSYWLEYFPPLVIRDLKSMGAKVSNASHISADVYFLNYSISHAVLHSPRLTGGELLLLQIVIHIMILLCVGNISG